jgi:hypothetical protein
MKNYSFWYNQGSNRNYLRGRVENIKKVIILINDCEDLRKSHFDLNENDKYEERIFQIIHQTTDHNSWKKMPIFKDVTKVKVVATAQKLMDEINKDSEEKAIFIGDTYFTSKCTKENGEPFLLGKTETSDGDFLNTLACPSVKFVFGFTGCKRWNVKNEKTIAALARDTGGAREVMAEPEYNASQIYTFEEEKKTFLLEIGWGNIVIKALNILSAPYDELERKDG